MFNASFNSILFFWEIKEKFLCKFFQQICCSSYHFWDEGIKRGKHLKILMYVLRASQAVNTCPWTMLVMIGTDCLVDVYITTICSLPWQPPSHFLNKIMINRIFILPKCLLTKSFAIDHLAFVKKSFPVNYAA